MPDGVVIVGGGQAGFQTAFSLRVDGFEGAITLIGEADECCEAIEHSAILAEAETLLFDVLSKLSRGAEGGGNVYAFAARSA